ncbi:MAG: signal peptidase I [Rhodospirillales bacterium]
MTAKNSGGTAEMLRTVFYAILIAIVVRTFAYEPFNIPSASMYPTLLEGDYLFVSKYSYGYSRYSLPFGLPLIEGRILFSEPARGDVAVFKLPTDNSTDYIKRIVGLPGDRIQVKEGILHINGSPVERIKVEDFVDETRFGAFVRTPQFVETLPNGVEHRILEISDITDSDNTDVYTVPEGHYFGMGDNRDRSQDSRFIHAVGFIPRENLVGRAEFIFFSVNGDVWKFWKWPTSLRFSRFFSSID